MGKKVAGAVPQGGSLKRILGVVGAIVLLVVYPVMHANTVVEHALHNAFPGWEVTYKRAWPRILGGVTASNLTLLPYGEEHAEESFHFDHVTIDIPFFQYYWSLTKGRKFLHAIKAVEMKFEGGHGQLASAFSEGLDLVGNASLSLFEAEGCEKDSMWIDDELAGMGLPASPLEMALSWKRANNRLYLQHVLSRPGIGRLTYRGERGVDESVPLLGIYEIPLDEPASEHWQIVDEGFVAARNRHCATKDGIDVATFIDRHLLSVRRTLQSEGLAATASLEAAYRGFATRGGEFVLALEFPRMGGLDFDDDAVLGDLVGRVNGNITINNEPLGLALVDVHARPFPEDSALTTYEILVAERGAVAAPPPGVADTPAATPAVAAPVPAEVHVAAVPAEAFIAPPPATAIDPAATISDYRELAKEVGQRFIVYSANRAPMRVEVVGRDGAAVRVRRPMPSGWAEHVLDRVGFERAERVR